jgi:hypothetical protein
VLSAPAATLLLRGSTSIPRLARVAAELGFAARAEALPARLRRELDLPREITHARLIPGTGSLRALVIELAPGTTVRETLSGLARSLATRAPHCLWMVLGCVSGGSTSFVACWLPHNQRTTVRALLVDREHIYASDAETLCAMSATVTAGDPDVLTHARWLEILGRDALTRRFFVALASAVGDLADDLPASIPAAVRGDLALLNVSRLLFLAFVQSKGWLNGDHAFLQNTFEDAVAHGGRIHRRILEPLFFGTLNTRVKRRQPRARQFGRVPYLNGGLFARTPAERIHRGARFSDAALGTVFAELLSRYRFTAREEPGEWSEAAIDPVILGRSFESLMDPEIRRTSGAFYTPAAVVERATQLALSNALPEAHRTALTAALNGDVVDPCEAPALYGHVCRLRVLDPACGSGAFLVHAMRVLADLRTALGGESRAAARQATLAGSIYGVDANPTAVWLCQLRLWLCLAVECDVADPLDIPPLPNLDRNIRVGDSLSGGDFESRREVPLPLELTRLRVRYVRAQGPRRRTLMRALDAAERRAAVGVVDARITAVASRRRELITSLRSRDLFGDRHDQSGISAEIQRLRRETRALRTERDRLRSGTALPFSFPAHFADVAATGGFDAIIGNPPWVRPRRLSASARSALRAAFSVCRPRAGVPNVRARAFGGQVDLAAPFVERSLALLRPGGVLALLLPSKLWSSIAGSGLREYLLKHARLIALDDFSEARAMFDAATYPSLLVASRPATAEARRGIIVGVTMHRRGRAVTWESDAPALRLTSSPSSPWLLVPPSVRDAFQRFAGAGPALSETRFGVPRLGVKTGCNEAFVVTVAAAGSALAEVRHEDKHGWIECSLLRPALRGELVREWHVRSEPREYVIWTHDRADRVLDRLPPHAARWLRQWRHELSRRADARAARTWWQLFRTAAASHDRHRVVWCDIGRTPRALVLEPGDRTVPLNSCYVVFADEDDAWALATVLNGPLTAAWLNAIAEPARGGYRRYLAWTMSMLPLPRDERRFRGTLAPLGRFIASGAHVTTTELLDATAAAYGIRQRDIAPLLEWLDV